MLIFTSSACEREKLAQVAGRAFSLVYQLALATVCCSLHTLHEPCCVSLSSANLTHFPLILLPPLAMNCIVATAIAALVAVRRQKHRNQKKRGKKEKNYSYSVTEVTSLSEPLRNSAAHSNLATLSMAVC